MGASEKKVVVTVREDDWDVLRQTLELDSESGSFDNKLRKEIKDALASIEFLGHERVRKHMVLKLLMPKAAWETLEETLSMDMTSNYVDQEVRDEIEKAMEKVAVRDFSSADKADMKTYSCCKVVTANQTSPGFMTSSFFVYEHKSKHFASINTTFEDFAPQEIRLISCSKGPKTFKELLDHLNEVMISAPEGTILVCKENLSSIIKVAQFGQEHLPDDFPHETRHGMEAAIATIVEDCFSGEIK